MNDLDLLVLVFGIVINNNEMTPMHETMYVTCINFPEIEAKSSFVQLMVMYKVTIAII